MILHRPSTIAWSCGIDGLPMNPSNAPTYACSCTHQNNEHESDFRCAASTCSLSSPQLYSHPYHLPSVSSQATPVTMLNTKDYNALDLAQPTNFRAMLQSGELLWGTSCRIPSEEAARIVATLPHHFCFIDSVGVFILCRLRHYQCL